MVVNLNPTHCIRLVFKWFLLIWNRKVHSGKENRKV